MAKTHSILRATFDPEATLWSSPSIVDGDDYDYDPQDDVTPIRRERLEYLSDDDFSPSPHAFDSINF